MFSIKMITFCKSVNCPTSQDLLAFQNKETAAKEAEAIESHLNLCEFCEAEVEFYANYPQSEEPCVTVEIPIPLYELAEALLNNKHKHFFSLNKLLSETEEFPLEKA
jgi:hypothetical protein